VSHLDRLAKQSVESAHWRLIHAQRNEEWAAEDGEFGEAAPSFWAALQSDQLEMT